MVSFDFPWAERLAGAVGGIDFLKTVLPMMVARPSVHGVIFQQWQDIDDPRYPNSGIIDADGAPKEIFEVLETINQASG